MSEHLNRHDAYVAGRASAAKELLEARASVAEAKEAVNVAICRENEMYRLLTDIRRRYEKQQWVSVVLAGVCTCLTLACIFLWGLRFPPGC